MSITHKLKEFSNFDNFYSELTSRNYHFVPTEVQNKLIKFKILIAGCGSTGGACIEALARAGVCNFILTDNGDYDLSNLNRQHARITDIGKNKAQFHAEEVCAINPFCVVITDKNGITEQNVEKYVSSVDFVFDAVDVTTSSGIKAKFLLHEMCHKYRKPVLSGLDLGYLQWGKSFDYRNSNLLPFDGKKDLILSASHPITALFKMFPFKVVPYHCYPLIDDLLNERVDFCSQMGCTSDALSAVIVPAILQYVESDTLINGWRIDLTKYRYTIKNRILNNYRGFLLRKKILKLLA